jgi:hypothetical protein
MMYVLGAIACFGFCFFILAQDPPNTIRLGTHAVVVTVR